MLFRLAAAMSQEIDTYFFSLENFGEHNVINLSNGREEQTFFFFLITKLTFMANL